MKLRFPGFLKSSVKVSIFTGIFIGIILTVFSGYVINKTSTDSFCAVCHVHPHVFDSWIKSSHFDNPSGVQVHCVECHLPPTGQGYLREKIRLGAKDFYGYVFKDSADFNWESKKQLEFAIRFTYESSCLKCHQNLFPVSLSEEGGEAHLYFKNNSDKVRCLNCHLDVGHYMHGYKTKGKTLDISTYDSARFIHPAFVDTFISYTEFIPGTNISFEMKAIDGGIFTLGSPPDEPYRKAHEGPQAEIKISSFFMAETEVSWDEYMAFYIQTSSEGRSTDNNRKQVIDGISGPTPPYGSPDRNWGFGKRPAISISYHAAETYCLWLSEQTGKTYRLPTEAEWEYACRAGTRGSFFFEGDPKKMDQNRLINKLSGIDTSTLNNYVIYSLNSGLKTQLPSSVNPNPFGLKNMIGNVAEFCSDWYSPETYKNYTGSVIENPKGPENGDEHVIRGGSYKSNIDELRCAYRDYTQSDKWLISDPQTPKSEWWYSDCFFVGFRLVCEYNEKTGNTIR